MKLLFVHSTKIKEDTNGSYYTGGSYNEEVWERYLSLCTEFSVMARKDPYIYDIDNAKKRFNYFNRKKIKYIEAPNLNSSIKSYLDINERMNTNNIIKNSVLDCDLLIARLPSSHGNIAIKFARKFNKPYLVEVVGCPWDSLWNRGLKGKVLAPISWIKNKMTIKRAPYAIYVTNEFLQKRYPCKGVSIGCSDVELPHLFSDIIKKRLIKIQNMRDDKPIILGTVGAIDVSYKGQEYVIKAISKLNKGGKNFEYYLVGDGDITYLKSISEKYNVQDNVKFLGSIPHEKVFEYLDNTDIYIQPSKTEGLPRALIEAMSRGGPSLGSKIGGIPELINRKFTFKNGSIDEICTLLKKLDKKTMLEEARHNFENAKEFEKGLLDEKRLTFYKEFAESVGNKNDKSTSDCE